MKVAPRESSDTFLFKAAVHLNNAGVSLMRRGCFCQAMTTFTEAIAVAKLCSCSKHIKIGLLAHPPIWLAQNDPIDVKKILDGAYHQLSHSNMSLLSDIELEVISDDEDPAWIQSWCLTEATPTFVKLCAGNFVINTGHLDSEVPNEQGMAIESSIISYNYGMAYLCLFLLQTSNAFIEEHYIRVFKLFHLAFLTLTSEHLRKEELQPHQMNHVLIIGLLVFCSLIVFPLRWVC